MFNAVGYNTSYRFGNYPTPGVGSIRYEQLEEAIAKAQDTVLREGDGAWYILKKDLDYNHEAPELTATVFVPASETQYNEYLKVLARFEEAVQEKLGYPLLELQATIEKELVS